MNIPLCTRCKQTTIELSLIHGLQTSQGIPVFYKGGWVCVDCVVAALKQTEEREGFCEPCLALLREIADKVDQKCSQ